MQLSRCGKRSARSVCTAGLPGSNGEYALEHVAWHVVFIFSRAPFLLLYCEHDVLLRSQMTSYTL